MHACDRAPGSASAIAIALSRPGPRHAAAAAIIRHGATFTGRTSPRPGPLGGASNSAMTATTTTDYSPGYETKKRLQTTYAQCGMKRRTGESSMYVLANTRAYLCATQALP
jgi:hypothetical protein